MEGLIIKMKARLRNELDEWLGHDIPEQGSDDYDTWQNKKREISSIETIDDVYAYLSANEERAREFFDYFGVEFERRDLDR